MSKSQLKPPLNPRVRTLHDVSATLDVIPYFLEGDHEIIAEATAQGKLKDLYDDDAFFAVAVGHLKLKHYLEYERIHGAPIEMVVNRLLWVFWAFSKIANPKMDDQPMPEIKEENGVLTTPFGPMVGSIALNLAEFFGWVLSRYGQIVGLNEDGTFKYEAVEPVEIIDMLDPASLLKTDDEGNPLFFEILSLTGLYNPKDVKKPAEPEAEQEAQPQDDGQGNTTSPNSAGGSTRRPRPHAKPNDA